MQGFYYISLDTKIHEITFSITEMSVFRIYTEPHAIDVDIWLYLEKFGSERKRTGREKGVGGYELKRI
jgi:hypothetical protein